MLAGAGIVGGQKAAQSPRVQSISSGLNSKGFPTLQPGRPAPSMMVGAKGGGWDRPQEPPTDSAKETMVEQIGKKAQQSHDGVIPGGPGTPDTAEHAPNTKKRMMEVEPSAEFRDEL